MMEPLAISAGLTIALNKFFNCAERCASNMSPLPRRNGEALAKKVPS